jgi:hypothetical protein
MATRQCQMLKLPVMLKVELAVAAGSWPLGDTSNLEGLFDPVSSLGMNKQTASSI